MHISASPLRVSPRAGGQLSTAVLPGTANFLTSSHGIDPVAGGKDSTVLAYVLSLLNTRHGYGLNLLLLSVDEGISGYRDDSLETVKRNEEQYGIPLTVVSYKQLYGWTMDEIVKQIGTRNNCTFCGVFRRQALDRGAYLVQATKVATGIARGPRCLRWGTSLTY